MVDRTLTVTAWESLFRTQVAVMRRLTAEFPSATLSMNAYDLLFQLSRAPERRLRLRELNRNTLITQPSVSRLVDRLVETGLVTKSTDPDDARGVLVELTDTGYSTFRTVAVRHMESITEYMGIALDDDELRTLTDLCERVRHGIDSK